MSKRRSNKRYFPRRSVGFTLIEALVTVSILAVLVAVAVPSLNDWILLTRLKASAAELVTDLQLARSESVRRNYEIVVRYRTDATQACYTVHLHAQVAGDCRCLDGAGVACAGGAGDVNRAELKTTSVAFNRGVNMTFTPIRVQFNPPTGLPLNLATLQVNFDAGGTRQLRVITNATGRPQICAPAGSSVLGYAACS